MKFKIVTNGRTFRIKKKGLLFWRYMVDGSYLPYTCGGLIPLTPAEFNTAHDAELEIRRLAEYASKVLWEDVKIIVVNNLKG